MTWTCPPAASSCGCSTWAPSESSISNGADYGVEGLTCGSCVRNTAKAVLALDGVHAAVTDAGYTVAAGAAA